MSNQNFCTVQEFTEFANTTPPTIDNLTMWLKEKTANKYTIIEIALLKNIYEQTDDNLKLVAKFHLDAINAFELLGISHSKNYSDLDKIMLNDKRLLERLETAIGDE
jgi:hypothetical protein